MGIDSGDCSLTFSENLKHLVKTEKSWFFGIWAQRAMLMFEYASLARNDELETNMR